MEDYWLNLEMDPLKDKLPRAKLLEFCKGVYPHLNISHFTDPEKIALQIRPMLPSYTLLDATIFFANLLHECAKTLSLHITQLEKWLETC